LYLASRANHEQYAKTHGYSYVPVYFDLMNGEKERGQKTYNKIAHLLKTLLQVMEEKGEQQWVL